MDLQSISYQTPFVAKFAFQRLCIPQPPCHFQPSHCKTMASALMSKTALAGQALVGKTRAARPQVRNPCHRAVSCLSAACAACWT